MLRDDYSQGDLDADKYVRHINKEIYCGLCNLGSASGGQ